MDASDLLRKLQAKPVWVDYKTAVLGKQAGCSSNACQTTPAGCRVNYPSYEYKTLVSIGRKNCLDCDCPPS